MNTNILSEYNKLTYDDYNGLFRLVKKVVKQSTGRIRPAMLLALAYLNPNVGAFHQVGTNAMVLNKLIIDGINMISEDNEKKKAYVFVLLLHEYLHAVGFVNETDVRKLSYAISRTFFGLDHYVTQFSRSSPYSIFVGLKEAIYEIAKSSKIDTKIEFISDFDNENANYFM